MLQEIGDDLKQYIIQFLGWLWEHKWELLIVGVVIRFIAFFLRVGRELLLGKDGFADIDDAAKVVIIGLVIYVFDKDGNRELCENAARYFSDATVAVLLTGLFLIAGLKYVPKSIKAFKGKDNKDEDDTSI